MTAECVYEIARYDVSAPKPAPSSRRHMPFRLLCPRATQVATSLSQHSTLEG